MVNKNELKIDYKKHEAIYPIKLLDLTFTDFDSANQFLEYVDAIGEYRCEISGLVVSLFIDFDFGKFIPDSVWRATETYPDIADALIAEFLLGLIPVVTDKLVEKADSLKLELVKV